MSHETAVVRVPAHTLERGADHASVHAACWAGPTSGPVFVCVHGLGGSHLNWMLLAPLLAEHGTVWAPDLAGFGLSPVGERTGALEDNLDLLRGFVATVSPQRRVVLLGNSLGALLSCTLAGRRPALVEALVLVGPAVPPISGWPDPVVIARFALLAVPGVGPRWLRRRERWLTPAEQVRESLEVNTVDPDGVASPFVHASIDLVARRRRMPHARRALLDATRSMLARLGPGRRRLWADMAAVEAPTLVLHGAHDRLVDEATVQVFVRRRRDWHYTIYPDLGHVAMVEAPDRVASDVMAWLREHAGVTTGF